MGYSVLMLRTALLCASTLQFFIVTGAVAAPVTYLWRDGMVATTPYYNGGFIPSTNQGVNNAGRVAGSVTDENSMRTAATWDGAGFTPLDKLAGYNESTANSLNNGGILVGASLDGSRPQPTIWTGSTPADLGILPGYAAGSATAINDSGLIVGLQYTGDGYAASIWNAGGSQILPGIAGAKQTEALALNNAGVIAGVSGGMAVIWRDGSLELLGGCMSTSAAYAINNAGQVAGRCGADAVVWQDGVMTVIGNGLASGIDDSGTVVFRTSDDPVQSQSYFWSAGQATRLEGFAWSQPFASTASGYVVGFGDPVPEPSTYALCLLGCVSASALRRLRSRRP